PKVKAVLIFPSPWPGIGTRRSRGIDNTVVRLCRASTWTRRIVSERLPGESFVVPNAPGAPLRLSLPSTRNTHRWSRHWGSMGRQLCSVQLGSVLIWVTVCSTWWIVAMANAELAETVKDRTPARTKKLVRALALRGRSGTLSAISLG